MASIAKRADGRWRARYRDDAGREHAKHFTRKVDAQRWLDEVTASIVTGAYVDPRAGRITFDEYFADWSRRQVWETGTERSVRLAAGSVTFGDMPLASRELKLHSLRHYYASGLIAAGCDVVTVQRALGHGSATITLDTYAHLWPTAEDKTRAAAASMIAEALDVAASVRTSGQR